MDDFKDFVSQSKNRLTEKSSKEELIYDISISSSEQLNQAIENVINASVEQQNISAEEKELFLEGITGLVQGERFITQLSDNIGNPYINESEDGFVERASEQLRKLLYRQFNIS